MNVDQKQVAGPEITVVVPAYNEADGIAVFVEQLSAALKQCAGEFEILAVDDGSRDATWESLRGYRRRPPGFRIRRRTA